MYQIFKINVQNSLEFKNFLYLQGFAKRIRLCVRRPLGASVKLCIVIVLDKLFKHALWHNDIDLHFMLHWLYYSFMQY